MMARTGIHKGIILAGGNGSRLYPVTSSTCKQLLPVYDKPMIYYPLSTLMQAGIRQILIITTPQDVGRFQDLLSDGNTLGISLEYAGQDRPEGIAQALVIGERFIDRQNVALILGDNIFYGDHDFRADAAAFLGGAQIYAYYVNEPSRYGVVTFDKDGTPISIDEKPPVPRSNQVVTGLYFYDGEAVVMAKGLRKSPRGEYEISDLNTAYLKQGKLRAVRLGRGIAWLDTGTHESLLEAGEFIATIEKRQGLKVGCIEEMAYRSGFIDAHRAAQLVESIPASSYRDYLSRMLRDMHE